MDNKNNTAKSPSSSSSSSELQNHHNQFWQLINTNNPTNTSNLNEENDTNIENDKEAMFEKPLTPSDVGKLNRLVIPKQHAERYFPIAAEASAEKGLLLSFEDDSGKPWRFRYSYWNSSQSYVLTKGWSRFVKENRLDAGDVVLFLRHRSHSDRLFIASRRRDSANVALNNNNTSYPTHPQNHNHHFHAGHYLSLHQNQNNRPVVPYQPDSSSSIHAGLLSPAHHQNQTTTIGNNNNNNSSSKILRLFGVNLECHDNEEEQCNSEPLTPDGSSMSSQNLQHQFYPQAYYPNPLHNHIDFTFSRDVKPMRDRRG